MRKSEPRKLLGLEETYRDILLAALADCAAGRDGSGLFGHNDRALEARSHQLAAGLRPAAVDELLDLGEQIEVLRARLGYADAFPLHDRFLKLRASYDSNTPGQPKIAKRWLDELEAEPTKIARVESEP